MGSRFHPCFSRGNRQSAVAVPRHTVVVGHDVEAGLLNARVWRCFDSGGAGTLYLTRPPQFIDKGRCACCKLSRTLGRLSCGLSTNVSLCCEAGERRPFIRLNQG